MRLCNMAWVVATATACVPWPHDEVMTPAVRGVISRDGAPAQGLRVKIADASDVACARPLVETETGERGEFQMTRHAEWVYFAKFLGMEAKRWWLCAETATGERYVFGGGSVGAIKKLWVVNCAVPSGGELRTLDCEQGWK